MKNYKFIIIFGYFISFSGISLLVVSYFTESLVLFFLGGAILVFGILAITFLMALNLFFKDKELEIDKLKNLGLTIVVCKNCLKENVLEDQYCIYCGEALDGDENGIQ